MNTTLTNNAITFHPLLDSRYLLEFYESDLDDILWALQTFNNFTLKDFFKLVPLAKAKKWQDVKLLAHKIKPNFKLVGFTHFYEILFQIELLDFNKEQATQEICSKIFDLDKEIRSTYVPILEMEMKRLNQLLNKDKDS